MAGSSQIRLTVLADPCTLYSVSWTDRWIYIQQKNTGSEPQSLHIEYSRRHARLLAQFGDDHGGSGVTFGRLDN